MKNVLIIIMLTVFSSCKTKEVGGYGWKKSDFLFTPFIYVEFPKETKYHENKVNTLIGLLAYKLHYDMSVVKIIYNWELLYLMGKISITDFEDLLQGQLDLINQKPKP